MQAFEFLFKICRNPPAWQIEWRYIERRLVSRVNNLYLSLSPDEIELLYCTLTAMCIEYEDAIEATSDPDKKSQYRDFRLRTKRIIEKIEELKP